MLKLAGEQLNQFLKEHLVKDNPHATPIPENFSTIKLDEAKIFLKRAFQKMKICRAELLAATLIVGLWLNNSCELFERSQRFSTQTAL